MTTPKARRRRDRIIITGIAITMTLVIGSSVENSRQDDASKKRDEHAAAVTKHRFEQFQSCISDAFTELTSTLETRAELTDPRALSIQTLIADLLDAKGDQAKGNAAVARYKHTQKLLKKATDKTPIPPFPTGKCDFS